MNAPGQEDAICEGLRHLLEAFKSECKRIDSFVALEYERAQAMRQGRTDA